MESLSFASISKLSKLLCSREISEQELLTHFLERFQRHDPELRSALELFSAESIQKHAAASTSMMRAIPGLLKDNIAQEGRTLSCASHMLEQFVSPYDASVTARLKQAGAFLVGRANMDEFAMGSSTETSAFGTTRNPWNTSRVAGGSSGGSAVAVAAGLVPWALGSDTGGSVRQPAALCGVVGLKPTYGLVPRDGLVAYASSLDQIGIFTRTVFDNALILSIIAGQSEKDATSRAVSARQYELSLPTATIGPHITIGVVENMLYAPGVDTEIVQAIESAIKVYAALGATIKFIKMPWLEYGAATYLILSRAEAASNLARFAGVSYGLRSKTYKTLSQMYAQTRAQGFGREVRSRILVGNYVLSASHSKDFYQNAKKVQQLIISDFEKSFENCTVLLLPTHPVPAFTFGAYDNDQLLLDLQDCFTCPVNLAGIPAISIPCGFTAQKLPIGLQLAGPALSEELLYQIAHAYEQNTEWHTMHPAGY